MIDQGLTNTFWYQQTRSIMPEFIRVIGRVIGEVRINDINKRIVYNQVVDISVDDARRSEDLRSAIKQRWIEVIQGNEMFKGDVYTTARQPQQAPPPTPKLKPSNGDGKVNMDELKKLIVETTQQTVKSVMDGVKPQQTVDSDKIAQAIASRINIQESKVEIRPEKVKEATTNVFIDVDEGAQLKTNINEEGIGIVTTQNGEKAKNKIKKIKNLKIHK